MTIICAKNALTAQGWQQEVALEIDSQGIIKSIETGARASGTQVSLLLPALANLHSHAFQRAMAGLTEARGPDAADSFWTWRKWMYRFLDQLDPDQVEAITAFAQMQMLESGYAATGEFHYLHHQPGGEPYLNLAEMSERIAAAAEQTGIGLCLLPVLYEQGGCDGRAAVGGQCRFSNTPDRFAALLQQVEACLLRLPEDAHCGVAPHSLRTVSQSGLIQAVELAASGPVHIHIAEQQAEVQEILAAWRARPVCWLLDNHDVDANWCLVHATHMLPAETESLAATGAVAGLCPITESSLGDGIFDGMRYRDAGGRWGVGTDSNIRISLSEELRTLEYSQRLRDRARSLYAEAGRSTGRVLFETALSGGAQALQRRSGAIAVGHYADLLALDTNAVDLATVSGDGWLDAWVFASDDSLVSDVWSAGRHVVTEGRHRQHREIESRYRQALASLVQSV